MEAFKLTQGIQKTKGEEINNPWWMRIRSNMIKKKGS